MADAERLAKLREDLEKACKAQKFSKILKKANEVLQLLGAVHDIAVSVRDQARKYAGEQAVTVQLPDREPERRGIKFSSVLGPRTSPLGLAVALSALRRLRDL